MTDNAKKLTKLIGNKFLRSKPRAAIFVLIFANFKSCALPGDPSDDRVMPRAEVRARAQASQGNITVNPFYIYYPIENSSLITNISEINYTLLPAVRLLPQLHNVLFLANCVN